MVLLLLLPRGILDSSKSSGGKEISSSKQSSLVLAESTYRAETFPVEDLCTTSFEHRKGGERKAVCSRVKETSSDP